ncbi:MAG: hypothetical protein QNJ77_04015 [Acidimicrobiia bacterium]|nr:hypothetical protein [Acidimicrobiia bacterium]
MSSVKHRTLRTVFTIGLLATACSGSASTPTASEPPLTSLPPMTVTTMQLAPTTATPEPLAAPTIPAGICDSFRDPIVAGIIETGALTETSGIAASRRYRGVLWAHNDSGDDPIVYAVGEDGSQQGAFEIDALAFDWEDMALGPGPDPARDYLYLGDIGDNLGFRQAVTVYRIPEPTPDPAGGFIDSVDTFHLVYPEAGPDSEAMMVDPLTGDIVVITKGGAGEPARIFRAPGTNLVSGERVDLEQIGTFDLESGAFVTAADIDESGALIVFRGYNQVWLWQRAEIELAATFAAEPCRTPSTAEVQGEAIAFGPDGYSYYTVSEGSNPDINLVMSDAVVEDG